MIQTYQAAKRRGIRNARLMQLDCVFKCLFLYSSPLIALCVKKRTLLALTSLPPGRTCTATHTHTHTRTHARTHTHTHTHTHMQTSVNADTHTHADKHTRRHTHKSRHTHTHRLQFIFLCDKHTGLNDHTHIQIKQIQSERNTKKLDINPKSYEHINWQKHPLHLPNP